jgi:fumarate hydratase class I
MATTPEFKYAPMFQTGKDDTEYYLLTKDGVSLGDFEGKPVLKVSPEALTRLTNQAFRDVSFLLRRSHNLQVAKILSDPEASANDKYVALTFLRNAEVACKGKLPLCQDTGTAIIHGEKGQQMWTGFCDEEAIARGVYTTYTEENLRYSQNAPLTMYEEVNTKLQPPRTDRHRSHRGQRVPLPLRGQGRRQRQQDLPLSGDQGTMQNPRHPDPLPRGEDEEPRHRRLPALPHRLRHRRHIRREEPAHRQAGLGHYSTTCPPAATRLGRAFRDVELEQELLEEAHKIGLGAQFGGKYFRPRRARHPSARHGASCPIGTGRFLLGRPQHQGQNQQGRHLDRADGQTNPATHPGQVCAAVPRRRSRLTSTSLWTTCGPN